eukprot:5356455-Pyramimonas_sp.AAC.2
MAIIGGGAARLVGRARSWSRSVWARECPQAPPQPPAAAPALMSNVPTRLLSVTTPHRDTR